MATNDCSTVGSGSCPCGKGLITVEWSIPDHPWAKESQAWYRRTLACEDCEQKYGFFNRGRGERHRLVLMSDLTEVRTASDAWHKMLREIKSSPAVKELAEKLDARLAQERSAAARYRVLRAAGLARIMSLSQYRQCGFALEPGHATVALKLLGIESPELQAMEADAEELWKQSQRVPSGFKIGI